MLDSLPSFPHNTHCTFIKINGLGNHFWETQSLCDVPIVTKLVSGRAGCLDSGYFTLKAWQVRGGLGKYRDGAAVPEQTASGKPGRVKSMHTSSSKPRQRWRRSLQHQQSEYKYNAKKNCKIDTLELTASLRNK